LPGFTGEWRDQTGLIHLRARYYDSALGRFSTRDPFTGVPTSPQTQHPYVYVAGNPINFVDPSGLFTPWDVVDFGSFLWSLYDFIECPTVKNAFWLGLDVIGLVPIIPSLGMVGKLGKIDEIGDLAKALGKYELHHIIPREIIAKHLPEAVAKSPMIIGKKGFPNRWGIPQSLHRGLHRGPGGGIYNETWKSMLRELGRVPEVEDVLRIREGIIKLFDLERFRP